MLPFKLLRYLWQRRGQAPLPQLMIEFTGLDWELWDGCPGGECDCHEDET